MSMEINGSNNQTQTDYAQRLREKQSLDRAGKTKEAEEGRNVIKESGKVPELQDEYISSEKSGAKPSGLYRIGQDENGRKKVYFDNPNQSGSAGGRQDKEKADALDKGGNVEPSHAKADGSDKGGDVGSPNVKADGPEKSEEKCVGNTDRVEREIRKLKEKKQQLMQQIRTASGEEEKVKELEKKLAQVESELSRKDTETYRRQHTVFSS